GELTPLPADELRAVFAAAGAGAAVDVVAAGLAEPAAGLTLGLAVGRRHGAGGTGRRAERLSALAPADAAAAGHVEAAAGGVAGAAGAVGVAAVVAGAAGGAGGDADAVLAHAHGAAAHVAGAGGLPGGATGLAGPG